MKSEVLGNPQELAARAVELLIEASIEAIEARGRFNWAVSGGSTPRLMLELLSVSTELDWSKTHLFQVDERIAPEGSDQRNATMLSQALLTDEFLQNNKPAGIHLMPVNAPSEQEGAAEYSKLLLEQLGEPPIFDLVQLGLGSDGHTASLIPDDPILDVEDRTVAISQVYQGTQRMSLTWPVLDKARQLLWVVGGESKQEAVKQLIDRDPAIPGSLPSQDRAMLLLDEAAS